MRTRSYVLGGVAAVALTAGSVTAVAASGIPVHSNAYGMDRVAVRNCAAPTTLAGARVTVMLGDMGGPMMKGSMMSGSGMRGYGGSMMGGPSRGMMSGGAMMSRATGWMMVHAVPQRVAAGTVSLVAVNHGGRIHELVVLPLAAGAAVGTRTIGADNTVDEAGNLGEASRSCGAGSGRGIAAGSAGWITMTLKPGRYELVCNRPGHYAAGMYTELDVT